MTKPDETTIRKSVMGYLRAHRNANYQELLEDVKNAGLKDAVREQVKSVVIPMIATGELQYGSGLRIELGSATKPRRRY